MAYRLALYFNDGRLGWFVAEQKEALYSARDDVVAEMGVQGNGLAHEEMTEFSGEWWLDAGGSVFTDEPCVSFKTGGITFGLRERHALSMLGILQGAGPAVNLPGYVRFTSWPFTNYIISAGTRNEAAAKLKELAEAGWHRIVETEKRLQDVYAGQKGLVRIPRCLFCGAEKPFHECCGKPSNPN